MRCTHTQELSASRQSGVSAKVQLLSASASSGSLRRMVIDSYKRYNTPVPSSLSTFLPRLQIDCPQVRAPRPLPPPSRPRRLPSLAALAAWAGA